MKQSLMAATASFAHLLGRPVAAKRAEDDPKDEKDKDTASASAEDDELVQGDDESDDDFDKRKKAQAEDKKTDDEDEDEHKARVKANKTRRAKRAKAEEDGDEDEDGDDDSDGEDMRKKGARSARLRERARCEAIFKDAAAGKNPALAATLAFKTDLPRSQAVGVLRAGGLAVVSGARNTLDRRMAANPIPPIAAGETPKPNSSAHPQAYQDATSIVVAGMKRRGESDEAIAAYVTRRAA